MFRPLPTSTLFPYTTLFRSTLVPLSRLAVMGSEKRLISIFMLSNSGFGSIIFSHSHRLSGELDRKSTRLNSSHANISYAVFCLKKKQDNHAVQSSDVDSGVL